MLAIGNRIARHKTFDFVGELIEKTRGSDEMFFHHVSIFTFARVVEDIFREKKN